MPELPICVEAEIIIKFEDGVERKYQVLGHPGRKGLLSGKLCMIEFKHPAFGEYFTATKI